MGKQKSFIIVGSTFLALIVIVLLASLIGSGKKSKCFFAADTYYVLKGSSIDLAPEVTTAGRIKKCEFQYQLNKPNIALVESGTSSTTDKNMDCWVFLDSESSETISDFRVDDSDVITIENHYWCVNGKSTGIMPDRDYSEDEIYEHAVVKNVVKSVWMLNGEETNYIYKEGITPVRDETSGHWFLEGVDTGYVYDKSIPATIEGIDYGEVELTATGTVNGKKVEAKTIIEVVHQDPKSITTDYINNTVYLAADSTLTLSYFVQGNSSDLDAPLQDVTYTYSSISGQPSGLGTVSDDGVVTAIKEGSFNVIIKAKSSSFRLGKVENIEVRIRINVIPHSKVEVEQLEKTRKAINDIGRVAYTPESKEKIDTASDLYNSLSEELKAYITKQEKTTLDDAIERYQKLENQANQ